MRWEQHAPHQAGPFELQAPVRRSHPSSFWIDCSRLEGLSMVTGKVKCLLMNIGFKMKEMMQKMPFDQNCEGLYFILDRQKRQWYKCCRQFTPVFKCIEVQPTAWYSQRSEFGVSMPFDHEDVQMCFREKQSPDQNCPLPDRGGAGQRCQLAGSAQAEGQVVYARQDQGLFGRNAHAGRSGHPLGHARAFADSPKCAWALCAKRSDLQAPKVHSLWIGESFPDWLPHCVASYIRTGHVINWWIYPEERERDFELLQCNEVGQRLLASPLLRLRDANELLPLELARKMFFYGVGPERKWQGWAPFSEPWNNIITEDSIIS
eukprot:g26079.t1